MQNLSVGGAAIRTRVDAEPGRFVRLHFSAGPGAALDADGVVVRCTSSAGNYVWGVMFVGLDSTTLARIKTAIANPPKAAPAQTAKPPSSRPPAASARPPLSAPAGSKRELKDLFKEALDEVKKR